MKPVVKENFFSQIYNEIMALSATGCGGTDSIKKILKGNEQNNGDLLADSY